MTAVNHTQPSFQTNAQKVATNTPTEEPPKAQMGSRRCHNIEMYRRGLINSLAGGLVTTATGLLVSAYSSFMSRDNSDCINTFISIANIGVGLAYVGTITHHLYLLKKHVLPELARIDNASGTVRSESAAKDQFV